MATRYPPSHGYPIPSFSSLPDTPLRTGMNMVVRYYTLGHRDVPHDTEDIYRRMQVHCGGAGRGLRVDIQHSFVCPCMCALVLFHFVDTLMLVQAVRPAVSPAYLHVLQNYEAHVKSKQAKAS